MLQLRRTFMVLEKYGVLRFVARYVRHETGLAEIDFLNAGLLDAGPDRGPIAGR